MHAEIRHQQDGHEVYTEERCHITELANDATDEEVSIARARVEAGVTTAWHKLAGTQERYVILAGIGKMELQGQPPCEVTPGDVVRIPAGIAQRISNIGEQDLVFLAICSPRFRPQCYISLE